MTLPKSESSKAAKLFFSFAQQSRHFGTPFNDPDGDVILRSSDLVDFRACKMILSMASPVFKDMFMLPQPSSDSVSEFAPISVHSGRPSSVRSNTSSTSSRTMRPSSKPEMAQETAVPVIPLAESGKTLHFLLTAICPVPTKIPNSFGKAIPVLAAAQKYDMEGALADVRALTKPMFDTIPAADALLAFGLACRAKLREEVSIAAWHTLGQAMSLESFGCDLKFVTKSALYELMKYRRSCVAAVVSVISKIRQSIQLFIKDPSQHRCTELTKSGKVIEVANGRTPQWWESHWLWIEDNVVVGNFFPTVQFTVDQLSFQDSLRAHGSKECSACYNLSNDVVARFCKKTQSDVEMATKKVRFNFDGI